MIETSTASASGRVLIIGLDGATWTNLLPRARSGEMPTLQKLLNQGAWGVLNSTIPALTPPAWATLVTGVNPGKHGIYHFRHTPAGDYYQRRLNTSRDVHAQAIWLRAGQHGKKVGVINVPLSYPVYPVNGFITSDAFAPDISELTAHPPELAAEFQNVAPDIENYPTAQRGTARYREQMLDFIDENERVLIQHADAAVRLMQSQPWEFFMVVWLILDRLQHYAWKFCEADANSKLTGDEKEIAARCTVAFKKIDAQLARLIEAAGANCSVILASDHGFGPISRKFFHTNRWLVSRGHLHLLPVWNWHRAIVGNFPRAWRTRWKLPLDSKFGLVNWRETRVWADCLEARAVGLRINRAGKYPQGIVADSDYETLRERLIGELNELKLASGEKVFFKVYRGEELYHGAHANAAPDLVAVMTQPFDGPPSFRRDLRSKEIATPNRHVLRDGGHEPEGIFLLSGKQIQRTGELAPQPIESIAPTALRLIGVPIADDIDGKIIAAALEEHLREATSLKEKSQAAMPVDSAQPEYSDRDSGLVEERLRKLGYLD